MCSVFVEYGRILRSVGHLGIISTHEAQGVSLRVCESASLRVCGRLTRLLPSFAFQG
jgi:hypothetical protein